MIVPPIAISFFGNYQPGLNGVKAPIFPGFCQQKARGGSTRTALRAAQDGADWESDSFRRMERANARFSRTMLGCQARGMIFPPSTIWEVALVKSA